MPDHSSAVLLETGRLILRGRLDETCHLSDLARDGRIAGELEVDLAEVTYINSLGVRDWVSFLRLLRQRGVAVTLDDCSETMVQQMNMIPDALGGAGVRSFQAPFTCDACGWDGRLRLDAAEVTPVIAGGVAPAAACPDCASPARFSDYLDRYFLFLE